MSKRDAATAALKRALYPEAPPRAISPHDLADRLNVTPQAVHNWAAGRSRPSASIRGELEALLGVPRTWWLTDEEREAAGLPAEDDAA